jgi:hypothetical protein
MAGYPGSGSIAFVSLSADDAEEKFAFVVINDIPANTVIFFHNRDWKDFALDLSGGSTITYTVGPQGLAAGRVIQIHPGFGWPSAGDPPRCSNQADGSTITRTGYWDVKWGDDRHDEIYVQDAVTGSFLTAIALHETAEPNWLAGTSLLDERSAPYADWTTALEILPMVPDTGVRHDVFCIQRALAETHFSDPADFRFRANQSGWWLRDTGTNDGLWENGVPVDTNNPESDALQDPNSPLYGKWTLPICFMPGTRIRTPAGEAAVETLAIGDAVFTSDGRTRPVKWIGRQRISTLFADPLRVLPIRIRAGALGEHVPSRDLFVSPDHALLLDGVLVHAGALVNGSSITRWNAVPLMFTYYHVELEDHALVLAENTPAETFLDNGRRRAFDNWPEYEALYPEEADRSIPEMRYPRAKAARQVPQATRERIARRARALIRPGAAEAA